jgi:lipoate-protein ligase A
MAVDEALLESVRTGGAPTLRLYGFDPPALSLGRNQGAAGAHDAAYLERQGIDLIRRPTGGLAVLHEHERTYAIVARLDRPPFDRGVLETYRAVARALVLALGTLGVAARECAVPKPAAPGDTSTSAACFASATRHEIAARGRKIVGSAQLRRRSAFLQHGSILLRIDPQRLERAIGAPVPRKFTALEGELGHPVDEAALDAAIVDAVARVVRAEPRSGALDAVERRNAEWLAAHKYGARDWTIDGKAPR